MKTPTFETLRRASLLMEAQPHLSLERHVAAARYWRISTRRNANDSVGWLASAAGFWLEHREAIRRLLEVP